MNVSPVLRLLQHKIEIFKIETVEIARQETKLKSNSKI